LFGIHLTLTACGGGGGGGSATVTVNTTDTVPNTFSLADQTDVAQGTLVQSTAFTVTGIDAPTAISVTGGEYSIDGGSYTSSPGTVSSGQTVRVRHTSSANPSTTVATVVTIGGISDTFSSTTSGSGNYTNNPDLSGQFLDAVLVNRNPDCRAYVADANAGNYSSTQISDVSNGTSDGASQVQIDMVIASNWNAVTYNYADVTVTADASIATHCRIISNMIPNHTFGVAITGPGGGGWVNAIDHSDTETTYIPVSPVRSNIASDTPRNPPIYDFDGILLNGVGIAMDSGFCYNPGVTTGPLRLQSNEAGNASGCGPRNTWFELPAYSIWHHGADNLAAVFDDYFAHGFVGTYHYHAMTHPLQEDNDQTQPPSNGDGSPVIGFAPDGFPIYGHWFFDQNNLLVRAESGYETYTTDSRIPIPSALHGTPPTPWDITNRPGDFASDFGLEMGRYEQDWYFAGTGNLDECNGAVDVNDDYGYYVTDKYPFIPPCTFGDRDPSFGKRSPTLP